MFKKKSRLTKNKEFESVFKLGLSRNSNILRVSTLKNNLKINRYSVIVSNKVSKKAVDRNKVKRSLRYIIKKHEQKIITGYDIVITTHTSITTKSFQEIEASLAYLFNLLKIVKK